MHIGRQAHIRATTVPLRIEHIEGIDLAILQIQAKLHKLFSVQQQLRAYNGVCAAKIHDQFAVNEEIYIIISVEYEVQILILVIDKASRCSDGIVIIQSLTGLTVALCHKVAASVSFHTVLFKTKSVYGHKARGVGGTDTRLQGSGIVDIGSVIGNLVFRIEGIHLLGRIPVQTQTGALRHRNIIGQVYCAFILIPKNILSHRPPYIIQCVICQIKGRGHILGQEHTAIDLLAPSVYPYGLGFGNCIRHRAQGRHRIALCKILNLTDLSKEPLVILLGNRRHKRCYTFTHIYHDERCHIGNRLLLIDHLSVHQLRQNQALGGVVDLPIRSRHKRRKKCGRKFSRTLCCNRVTKSIPVLGGIDIHELKHKGIPTEVHDLNGDVYVIHILHSECQIHAGGLHSISL